MKQLICLISIVILSYNVQSQSELTFYPNGPEFDCYNCFSGDLEYNTGSKFGVNFGLVKPISPKFDLTSNIGYGFWSYKVIGRNYYNGTIYNTYEESNHVFNFSIGERFHLANFKSSSIYSGLNFNFQLNTNEFTSRIALSLEPTIGWRKLLGEKSEMFFAAGYDQFLTSYNKEYNRKPGRIAFNIGYNLILKNKKLDKTE